MVLLQPFSRVSALVSPRELPAALKIYVFGLTHWGITQFVANRRLVTPGTRRDLNIPVALLGCLFRLLFCAKYQLDSVPPK